MGKSKNGGAFNKPPDAYGTFSSSTQSSPTSSESPSTRPCARSSLIARASLLSRLFFLWFEYLVDVSKTRAIRIEDIFELDDDDRSAATYDLYMARMTQPRDFVWTTWRLYWRLILKSGLLALMGAVGDVLSPLLMYVVIAAVTNQETSVMFIVGVLVARHVIKLVTQVAKEHGDHINSIVATRTVGALQTFIFDASVTSTWSRDVTASEPLNLFYELSSVHQVIEVIHSVWVSPLSLAANLYLLYYILGDAVLGSIIAAATVQLISLLFGQLNKRVAKHFHASQGRRLQIMDECFKTMQSIKLHAWESRFLGKIRDQRKHERSLVLLIQLIDALWRSVLFVLPEVVLAGSFAVLFAINGVGAFNPAMAFAALSILYRAKWLIGNMVWLVSLGPTAAVSLKQALRFLNDSQRPPQSQQKAGFTSTKSADIRPAEFEIRCAVKMHNAALGRLPDEPSLIMVAFTIPVGSLTVIHGNTGAGKSTLLEAIIDNALLLNPTRGSIHVRGRIAYCSQDPWLQTLSIRDNILFGLPFDEHKYLNVLHACCLLRDLGAMPHGDDTVIGPKGLTLSGGQKARIALARACYADADVYLLDSSLSSVDAIVQGDIFHRCIIDLLRNKTVVLATHNEEIVSSPFVDQVVMVKDSRVLVDQSQTKVKGTKANMSNRSKLTVDTPGLRGYVALSKEAASHDECIERLPDNASSRPALKFIPTQSTRLEETWRRLQVKKIASKSTKGSEGDDLIAGPRKSAVAYLMLCGGFKQFLVPFTAFYVLSHASLIAAHLWICSWSDQVRLHHVDSRDMNSIEFFLLAVGLCSFWALMGSLTVLRRTSKAADKLFDRMVRGVLFAPMSFFYNQPIGEIMTRFSVDVRMVDENVDFVILEGAFTFLGFVMPCLVLTYVMPEMLTVFPVVTWLLYRGRYQLKVALEVRRLAGSSYAPCFDAISEAMSGRHIIQAFGPPQVARFRHEHHQHLDKLLQMKHAYSVLRSWSDLQFFKVDTLLLVAMVFAVELRRDSLIPLFGLALHYMVTLTSSLCAANSIMLECGSDMVKIERVLEYGAITPEQARDGSSRLDVTLPQQWPSAGEIVFDNVSFQYDDLSGPVLQNINLHIRSGEKIGLVGRTGAGKSSLTMALFRIHELLSGRILIDGVDIALADVYAVRSRLSIIPQSPLFFQGTLRSYLDPFDEMDDLTLWEALRKTGLASVVTRMEGKLVAQLQENAENLSLGERQLLCLSRVLLKQSRVVVLDEATAAIDHASDEALQRVVQSEFRDATVISIAHRLDSIMNFDRVVVMEDGCIVQCGSVEELVSDATGPFFDLLEGALLKM